MSKLKNKVAIITGAASGIGAATATVFVREGCTVILTDVNDRGEAVAKSLGAQAQFLKHDVGSSADWEKVIVEARKQFNRLDILVNNAGYFVNKSLADTTEQDIHRVFHVNQLGTFLGMRAAAPLLGDSGGGSIVNLSSGAGLRANMNILAYAGTKWAIRGMTKCAALELAQKKIRVNSVHPGVTRTPMIEVDDPGFIPAVMKIIPLQRMGEPTEVAELVLYLSSDDSSYVSGGEFTIDGAQTV